MECPTPLEFGPTVSDGLKIVSKWKGEASDAVARVSRNDDVSGGWAAEPDGFAIRVL